MKNHYLSFLLLLLVEGVFSDVMMSVMEGDSVTLQINVTEIQTAETLLWKFNGQDEFMAKIDREADNEITVPGNDDGRFKNRLKVDQIGSLNITNIRTEDSGLYTLEIRNSRGSSYKRFRVTVYRVSDVETKSVMEGESVTLQTDLTGLQKDDVFQWSYFTPEETPIAQVTKGAGDKNITVFDDTDVKFKKRLFVNSETGDLMICNITTKLSGLYKLEIITSQTKPKIYRVSVIERSPVVPDPRPSPAAPAAGLSIGIVAVLMLVAAAVGVGAVVIYYRCCKKQKATDKDAGEEKMHMAA